MNTEKIIKLQNTVKAARSQMTVEEKALQFQKPTAAEMLQNSLINKMEEVVEKSFLLSNFHFSGDSDSPRAIEKAEKLLAFAESDDWGIVFALALKWKESQ